MILTRLQQAIVIQLNEDQHTVFHNKYGGNKSKRESGDMGDYGQVRATKMNQIEYNGRVIIVNSVDFCTPSDKANS